MRVSVVGLGPGPEDCVTAAARARLYLPGARVFARTRFFPGLERLLAGVLWESFDDLYERAESLQELQIALAKRLLDAGGACDAIRARDGSDARDAVGPTLSGNRLAARETSGLEVVLAVPGDGVLG